MHKYTQSAAIVEVMDTLMIESKKKKSIRDSAAQVIVDALLDDGCFMDKMFEFVIEFLNHYDKDNSDELESFYKFITLFSSSNIHYPSSYDIPECKAKGITFYTDALVSAIDKGIEVEDFIVEPGGEKFSEILLQCLDLFFHYTSYRDDSFKPKLAPLVPKLFLTHTHLHSFTSVDYLHFHADAINVSAQGIDTTLRHAISDKHYAGFYFVIGDLLDMDASPRDFYRKNAKKVFEKLLDYYTTYDIAMKNYFIERLVLDSLKIVYKDQESVRKTASKYDRHLKLLESDFEAYKEAKMDKSIPNIKKSLAKDIAYVVGHFKGHDYELLLDTLMKKLGAEANKPKVYNQKMKPSIVFKDLTFKMLVIEELMYTQEVLKPQMQLSVFANETKPEIDIDDVGYAPIKPVLKYFKNLDITQEQLDKVEVLRVGDGCYEWAGVYQNLMPHYDPGNDQMLDIDTKKAIKDLELLPNLKRIEGYGLDIVLGSEFLDYVVGIGITIDKQDY